MRIALHIAILLSAISLVAALFDEDEDIVLPSARGLATFEVEQKRLEKKCKLQPYTAQLFVAKGVRLLSAGSFSQCEQCSGGQTMTVRENETSLPRALCASSMCLSDVRGRRWRRLARGPISMQTQCHGSACWLVVDSRGMEEVTEEEYQIEDSNETRRKRQSTLSLNAISCGSCDADIEMCQ